MTLHLSRPAILALTVVATNVLACGGNEPALEPYFERVATIKGSMSEAMDALDRQLEALDDDDTEGLSNVVADLSQIIRDAIEEVRGLKAPEEAASARDDFLSAGLVMSGAFDDLAGELRNSESVEAAFARLEDTPRIDAAADRFETACIAFEAVASGAGIDVDLDC